MKPHTLAVGTTPPLRWLLATATVLAAASCQRGEAPPRPTPAPHFASLEAASRAELVAYAEGLQYDTTRPASDAQYLVVPRGGQLAVGPYATVASEIGAGTISASDLAHGRILAKLWLERPSPEADLPGGVSYIWVDSTDGALRAMLIPVADSIPLRPLALASTPVCATGGLRWVRPAAWLDVLGVRSATGTMIACYPCDCRICCDSMAVRDLSPDTALRRIGEQRTKR